MHKSEVAWQMLKSAHGRAGATLTRGIPETAWVDAVVRFAARAWDGLK
jgi:hypothetical protein